MSRLDDDFRSEEVDGDDASERRRWKELSTGIVRTVRHQRMPADDGRNVYIKETVELSVTKNVVTTSAAKFDSQESKRTASTEVSVVQPVSHQGTDDKSFLVSAVSFALLILTSSQLVGLKFSDDHPYAVGAGIVTAAGAFLRRQQLLGLIASVWESVRRKP